MCISWINKILYSIRMHGAAVEIIFWFRGFLVESGGSGWRCSSAHTGVNIISGVNHRNGAVAGRGKWNVIINWTWVFYGPADARTAPFFSPFFSLRPSQIWWAGSSVGITTGRSGDRILMGGEIFLTCPDLPWCPPSLLYNGYRVFPGSKERPGRDADPSHTSSAVGHERVELYLYSPLWTVRPVQNLSDYTRVQF